MSGVITLISIEKKNLIHKLNKPPIRSIIISFIIIAAIIAVGSYLWIINQPETTDGLPIPYVDMSIEQRSSFCIVINVTKAGHVWGWEIGLSDCAIKICPP
ncbi:MAG: hypothetical protein ACPL1K_01530, partial [Candidatus Kryptoniota bacterium]